jgi:hypothetical protein
VVADVLGIDAVEVPVVEHEDVVDALATERAEAAERWQGDDVALGLALCVDRHPLSDRDPARFSRRREVASTAAVNATVPRPFGRSTPP